MSLFDDFRDRKKSIRVIAEAAIDRGMNYALTINPDVYPRPGQSPIALIHGVARDVFQGLTVDLNRMSRRAAKRETIHDFLGFYEMTTKRRVVYPHAHLAIRLTEAQAEQATFFFIERLGLKERVGEDFRYIPAQGKLISDHLGKKPHAFLEPITDPKGWISYLAKATDEASQLVLPREFVRPAHSRREAA
jgi:hypothetical protein